MCGVKMCCSKTENQCVQTQESWVMHGHTCMTCGYCGITSSKDPDRFFLNYRFPSDPGNLLQTLRVNDSQLINWSPSLECAETATTSMLVQGETPRLIQLCSRYICGAKCHRNWIKRTTCGLLTPLWTWLKFFCTRSQSHYIEFSNHAHCSH